MSQPRKGKKLRASDLVTGRLTFNFDPRLYLTDPGSLNAAQLATATAIFEGSGPHNIEGVVGERWITAGRDQTYDHGSHKWFNRSRLSDGTLEPWWDPDAGASGRWIIRGRFDKRFRDRYLAGDFGGMPHVNFVEL